MNKYPVKDLENLVKQELLPVYLKYHREHTIETPQQVLDFMATAGLYREPQIPALLKPIKN